jgi:hypothetical protein
MENVPAVGNTLACVVQSRLGDSENLRLDRQDRVVNITARVNG